MSEDMGRFKTCPDCGVRKGKLHTDRCDVELCPDCGGQMLSCGCKITMPRLRWDGYWPGAKECRELGFYEKIRVGSGGKKVTLDRPQLDRMREECKWNKEQARFVLIS